MNNYLTVQLPAKIKVSLSNGKEYEIDKIEIIYMTDSPVRKTVTAVCKNYPSTLVLWKDAEYDAIGQWTDTDVINRVLELHPAP